MQNEVWRAYWLYWRVLAAIFAFLYLVAMTSAFINNPVVPALEMERRALASGVVMLAGPFVGALVPTLVPRLWFWPWMRKKRRS